MFLLVLLSSFADVNVVVSVDAVDWVVVTKAFVAEPSPCPKYYQTFLSGNLQTSTRVSRATRLASIFIGSSSVLPSRVGSA